MLFSTTDFIFYFLPAALLITAIGRRLGYNIFLLAVSTCSLFLYAWHVPIYLLLLLASAAANFILAGFIADGRRTVLYFTGIAGNLALLGYFKYADFFISTVNAAFGLGAAPLHIVLPLAISFITFEQIAFLSDVRSGRVPRGSPIEYFAFITLFPKLIAGPIIRYTEILPQIREAAGHAAERIFTGLCIFSVGLFNKTVIADSLDPIVDPVYAAAGQGLVPAGDAILATLAYATQILFDFSGYSTMAIGLAWMFGIRLPINFLSPYKATSIIEFWRRWHITLSRFLRDYLYIPLGGGRQGEARRYANLMIVMLLGGLWHGAGWVFVAWGAIHGAALAINHGWRALAPDGLRKIVGSPVISWPATMLVVVAAWVFFNAPDFNTAANIFRSLGSDIPTTITGNQVGIVAGSWAVALLLPNAAQIFRYTFLAGEHGWEHLPPLPVPSFAVTTLSALAFVVSIVFILSGTPNAFIYFQF